LASWADEFDFLKSGGLLLGVREAIAEMDAALAPFTQEDEDGCDDVVDQGELVEVDGSRDDVPTDA
jgi:hypothetical protein